MFALGTQPYVLRDKQALIWSFEGYHPAKALPDDMEVTVLTPPSTILALAAGYQPQWVGLASENAVCQQ